MTTYIVYEYQNILNSGSFYVTYYGYYDIVTSAKRMLSWPVDVVLRPERLVSVGSVSDGGGLRNTLVQGLWITAIYSVNLLFYAAPLTLAGFGVGDGSTPPGAVVDTLEALPGDPAATWTFLVSLTTNSAFLLMGTALTFCTFHFGIVLSGASSGILRSLRAVAYSTGIYLAIVYTLVWYVAMTPSVSVAADILVTLQADFFYYFIDMLGANLELPGGRPDEVDPTGLTGPGQIILVLLALSAVYYCYVLYVGGRIGHGADRVQALIATGFVLISPALYAIGTILFSLYI